MRKGLILTARDLKILEHLWYGPATDLNIFQTFFAKEDGNIKTRKRIMAKRLQKMESAGIIKSTVHEMVNRTIYVLDKKGCEYVADLSGREVSNFWCHFPKNDIFHDLIVSGLAKIVAKEIDEIEGYSIDSLVFERQLKTLHKGRKGVCYPDFQICIKKPDCQCVYDVEIDCGNISRADLIAKMNSFRNVMLFITHKAARMELLYRYIIESHCGKAAYICSYERIVNQGFFKGRWFSIIDRKWVFLDPSLEGK